MDFRWIVKKRKITFPYSSVKNLSNFRVLWVVWRAITSIHGGGKKKRARDFILENEGKKTKQKESN